MTTQSWKRVTKGTFLPSYIEIGPVVSDKKIFKVFYIAIKPYPPTAIFFFFFFFWRIMTAWKNLIEGHQRNILAKLNWNRFSGFWQEDFQSFLSRYIGKISPTPKSYVFWQIRIAWTFLVEGHQSNIVISQGVFDKKNFKVFYTDIYGK